MTQITIPNVPTEVSYSVISSSTGPFTVPFAFFNEGDVQCTVTDALGAVTNLVHSTDFIFASKDVPIGQEGAGYTGGTITLNVAIGADGATTLLVFRDTVIDRTSNYPNTGPFSMPLLNDEQNKHIAIMQELAEGDAAIQADVDANELRSIRAPIADTSPQMELPIAATRADKILQFDASGHVAVAELLATGVLSRATIGSYMFPRSAEEIAAGVTPVDEGYDYPNVKRFGAIGDGVADDTQAFIDCFLANTGAQVWFPEGTYLCDRIRPWSGTTVWMSQGVTIKRTNANQPVIYFLDTDDVHFHCNGALLDASTAHAATGNHVVNFIGANRCTVRDAHIFSGGANNLDGVYFGVSGTTECRDCGIIGGKIEASKRNGVSFVAAVNCFLDGVEIFDATNSAPRRGVDFEANNHTYLNQGNRVENCRIHDNGLAGVGSSFGDQNIVRNNRIYDNGGQGISIGTGAQTRSEAAWRPNIDVMGISNFDQALGWITVGGDLDLMAIGQYIVPGAKAGATLPGGIVSQAYVICEHSGTDKIRIGSAIEVQVITSLSGAEVGTTDPDPDISDFYCTVHSYYEGQGSKNIVTGNYVYGNTAGGITDSTATGCLIDGNYVFNNGAYQIYCIGAKDVKIINNTCYEDTPSAGNIGILVNYSSFATIENNTVYNIGTPGISFSLSSYSTVRNNTVMNCGELGSSGSDSSLFVLNSCVGVKFIGNVGRCSESYPAISNGLYCVSATLQYCHFAENIFKLAGPDVANSFLLAGSNHYIAPNNVVYDGTTYGVFSKTYDPPSLADGAGVTTTVTVAGASLGDFVDVSFSQNMQGILMTAWTQSGTIVGVRMQNESGGVLDLASGTLTVKLTPAN